MISILVVWAIAFVPIREGYSWPARRAEGFSLLSRFWDGPSYLVVATSMYEPSHPVWDHYGRPNGLEWNAHNHAAHLVGYPAVIRLFAMAFGYQAGLLVATLVCSTLCMVAFFHMLRRLGLSATPLLASVAFLFFPHRWLVYHSLPASEPLFILCVILSVIAFEEKKLAWAGVFGGLAAITRVFGIMLLPAYALAWLIARDRGARVAPLRLLWLALIPAAQAAHFALYKARLGSFWAYFKQNGSQLGKPFIQVFASTSGFTVGGGAWGDVFVYLLLFYCLAWVYRNGNRTLFAVSASLGFPIVFTTLPDIGRFMLPSLALVLFPTLDGLLHKKEARIAMFAALPAVYLYAWRCTLDNNLSSYIYDRLHRYLRAF